MVLINRITSIVFAYIRDGLYEAVDNKCPVYHEWSLVLKWSN
jgi:hypothetical protein